MLLNCGVGEDSWESLGLQGDPTSQSSRKSVLNIHWKDWCWSWSSNTLATWWEELSLWKRPWHWERLKAGGDDRGWDGWMAWWTWVWASSGNWSWTGKPGMSFKNLDMTKGLNWTEDQINELPGFPWYPTLYHELLLYFPIYICSGTMRPETWVSFFIPWFFSPMALKIYIFWLHHMACWILVLYFFNINLLNWRLITLKYFIGFAIHQHESTTGIKPVSPALAGGFLSTGQQGKSLLWLTNAYIMSFRVYFKSFIWLVEQSSDWAWGFLFLFLFLTSLSPALARCTFSIKCKYNSFTPSLKKHV